MAYSIGIWRRLVVASLLDNCKCPRKGGPKDENEKHGPKCNYTPNREFKSIEDERELKVITFLNTVIAITPTPEGHQDRARRDPSRPHKRVTFGDNITNDSPVELTAGKADIDDTLTYQFPKVLPTELTPSAIEQLILCNCVDHEHCPTCQSSQSEWNTYLKSLTLPNQNDKSTRWIASLFALDRAVKIWLGEHINSLGGWGASVRGSSAKTAIQDHFHLSYALSEMVDNYARKIFYSILKADKALHDAGYYAEKVIRVESLADSDKKKLALETFRKRYTAAKKKAHERINAMVHIADGLEKKLRKQVKDASCLRSIKCIREYVNRNSDDEKAWPAGSQQKLKLIHGILILVLKDVRSFYEETKKLAEPWIVDQTKREEEENAGRVKLLDGTGMKASLKGLVMPSVKVIEQWHSSALMDHRQYVERMDTSSISQYGSRLFGGCKDCKSNK